MLLTTGAIALGRKIRDERAKKQEAKQGLLTVGNSDVAKRAFTSQTSKMIEAGPAPTGELSRAGTTIKYEDPNDIASNSPEGSETNSPAIYSPKPQLQDMRQNSSQVDRENSVKSEKARLAMSSPQDETATGPASSDVYNPRDSTASSPPPYSPTAQSSNAALSPSVYSRDPDNSTLASSDTRSIASGSTGSGGPGIRVKTKGSDLKSGFGYHPALFDVHVAPDKWDSFTYQIIESTKFGAGDYGKMVGAATATALTGAIGTSIFVGRSMNRSIQEKKVKDGLADMSDGGLGDTINQWNEEYFGKRGLFVHLELSESALKNVNQKSRTFRKSSLMYSNREDRERKRDERKFVLVVTKLDEEGLPSEAMQELSDIQELPTTEERSVVPGAVEIASSDEPNPDRKLGVVAELPADEGQMPVELPAELPAGVSLGYGPDKWGPPSGYAELDGGTSELLEKTALDENPESNSGGAEGDMTPQPLSFTDARSPYAMNKEMT